MFDMLPLMCAAAMSVFYSGTITSVDQIKFGQLRSFSQEVPNNGFILQPTPDIWGMGIQMKDETAFASGGGLLWFTQKGPAGWYKGQTIRVYISACDDNSMYSALKTWNALAPTQ